MLTVLGDKFDWPKSEKCMIGAIVMHTCIAQGARAITVYVWSAQADFISLSESQQ